MRIVAALIATTTCLIVAGRGYVQSTCPAAAGPQAKPRVVLSTTQVDLGKVSAEKPLEAQFAVRNDGQRRLIIHRADNCCAMGESEEGVIIQPGESGLVHAMIYPEGQRGRIQQSTRYISNDPAMSRFELTVTAEVVE